MTLQGLKLSKWTEILSMIERYDTMSKLSKFGDVTNSHAIDTIQYFIKYKLVTIKQEGREKKIQLTAKGMQTVRIIKALRGQIQ